MNLFNNLIAEKIRYLLVFSVSYMLLNPVAFAEQSNKYNKTPASGISTKNAKNGVREQLFLILEQPHIVLSFLVSYEFNNSVQSDAQRRISNEVVYNN